MHLENTIVSVVQGVKGGRNLPLYLENQRHGSAFIKHAALIASNETTIYSEMMLTFTKPLEASKLMAAFFSLFFFRWMSPSPKVPLYVCVEPAAPFNIQLGVHPTRPHQETAYQATYGVWWSLLYTGQRLSYNT